MRSRDGSSCFSLSISIIPILFFSLALNASEYLISYRYYVKDAVLHNETLDISQAMTKCPGTPFSDISLDSDNDKDIKTIISKNREKFIDYMHKIGLDVRYKDTTTNYQNRSHTIMTLKTTCFKVHFNDNLVRMSPLK